MITEKPIIEFFVILNFIFYLSWICEA